MNCFPCFKSSQKHNEDTDYGHVAAPPRVGRTIPPQHSGVIPWAPPPEAKVDNYRKDEANSVNTTAIAANQFTFRELATATKNFRQETLLGECGYGRVYKGTLQPSGKVVTVKRLDKNRANGGNKEFLREVLMLSLLRHSNLLNLVGYCADGDQRLLVYEYMPMGSVNDHLLGLDEKNKSLDWATRIKIASGIAKGIEYLHDKAKPSVIYRDLKCTNVMLDEDFNPKLSDHGLAKLGGSHMNNSQVIVMGSFGYCAPEYEKHGELTVKSDVYNFGVVLLELITGRGAMDTTKKADEQNLVKWAQPIFKDPRRYSELADPRLNNSVPVRSLNQVVGIAAMCIQDEPDVRPLIGDVVAALSSFTKVLQEDPTPVTISQKKAPSRKNTGNSDDYSGDSSDYSSSDYSDEESDNEIHYKDKHDHMVQEIGYPKNQNDHKDKSHMDHQEIVDHNPKNQYDQNVTGMDEEIYSEIPYKQKHDHMEQEIGYRKNQHDQKRTDMNENRGYLENQYDQENTHMEEEILKNQYKYVSSDEESDYDDDQDEQNHPSMNKEIGHNKENQFKYVSSDEESDYDQNQDEHKHPSMDKEIGHNKENQYKYVSSDEESDYDQSHDEHKHPSMDKEIGYNKENQYKYVSSDEESDHDQNRDEHKHPSMDKEIDLKNQYKYVSSDEESDYDQNEHEHKHPSMDKEIDLKNQYKYVSSDEESDYDQKQDEHKHISMEKEIDLKNQYKYVSSDEESDHDQNEDEHKHPSMDKEIDLKNQYKYVSSDEESDHDQNEDEHKHPSTSMYKEIDLKNQYKYVSSDEESDYDQNQDEHKHPSTSVDKEIDLKNQYKYVFSDEESDYDQDQDEHKHPSVDKIKENQYAQKIGSRVEQRDHTKNHYEIHYCSEEESDSEYDSGSMHEDIILSSRHSSRNSSARSDPKGRSDMILKDEDTFSHSNSKTSSSNVGFNNRSV